MTARLHTWAWLSWVAGVLVAASATRNPWYLALLLAWSAGSLILLSATTVAGRLGRRGLSAMERLMGLLLTAIAVEMLVQGFRALAA